MAKALDLTGQRFGHLVAIERVHTDKGVLWKCRCDCGNETFAKTSVLRTGGKKSCGCKRFPPIKDLTGKKFGKLTVLKQGDVHITSGGHRQIMYICRCDCGNEVTVSASNLRSGITQSCGCIKTPDLTGKKINRLTALKRDESRKGMTYYICRCDCGNITSVSQHALTSGKTKSCGCAKTIFNRNKLIDLSGKRFGKLTVIKRVGTMWGSPYYECKCDCGNTTYVSASNLRSGGTKTCGECEHHNLSSTRIYGIYQGMKQRCLNPKNPSYEYYGKRGIKICKDWLDDFMNFYNWSMDNGYEDSLSIDRIDVNGNYEPSNCRWATVKEQANNTRNNHIVSYKGEEHTISEWADILNLDYKTVSRRISTEGWDAERAFNTPLQKKK